MNRRAVALTVMLVLAGGTAAGDTEPGDLALAKDWLLAVALDGASFESTTGLPFTYRTVGKINRCQYSGRNRAALMKWAPCFRRDQKRLVEEIRAGAELRAPRAQDTEPKGLQAVAKQISGDGRWLFAYINGDGITFTFLFRVTGDGGAAKVTALVVEGEVESG